MAAGYAWTTPEGDVGFYKRPGRGSQLSLKALPKDATNVVLHTRLATQGPIEHNENNHPVVSPEQNIALVHNGVIWNDGSIRAGLKYGDQLAQVDSSVIPALIEEKGIAGLAELAGDAAVAWIDSRDSKRVHVARIEHSPVSFTWLEDGTMVMASTPYLLKEALRRIDIAAGETIEMAELDYLTFEGGEIVGEDKLPEPVGFHYGYAASTRHATSGGGSESTITSGIGSSFSYNQYGWSHEWDDEYEGYVWEKNADAPMALEAGGDRSFYYTVDHWGEYNSYETLEDLIRVLQSYSSLTFRPDERAIPGVSREAQWVERIGDIGFCDPNEDIEWSWVSDRRSIDDHEVPSFVTEGVDALQKFGAIV